MTPSPDPKTVEAMARAWDAEEAAMCGEPSPWDLGREDDGFELWANERRALAQAAIRTLQEMGWRCVGEDEVVAPREPTEAMMQAGGCSIAHPSVYMGGPGPIRMRDAARHYRAMIAAIAKASTPKPKEI